ncbi:MAG: hypothetical protein JST42_10690, partial [Bacteroidetes bacterium]|nr:hypothetical protein [Bacteroidota bacterium]
MANNRQYADWVKTRPGFLVEQIIKEVITQKAVDVSFEDEDDPWAMVKIYRDNEDHEMA